MGAGMHVANLVAEQDPDALMTRYVLVTEVVDSEGQRDVWINADEDARTWEVVGLLIHALRDRFGEE